VVKKKKTGVSARVNQASWVQNSSTATGDLTCVVLRFLWEKAALPENALMAERTKVQAGSYVQYGNISKEADASKKTDTKTIEDKKFVCPETGKKFATEYELLIHRKRRQRRASTLGIVAGPGANANISQGSSRNANINT
jgi:hypothetical protein